MTDEERALLRSIAAHGQDLLIRYSTDLGMDGAARLMQSDLNEYHLIQRKRREAERQAEWERRDIWLHGMTTR